MTGIHLLLILGLTYYAASDDLVVKTNNGDVRGRIQTTIDGGSYYAYQGIPYAKPPLGNLRFQAPQPIYNWSGTRDATKDSKFCFQVKNDSPNESEDCLYVNVFTPVNKNNGPLPVMFYIYGGAFRGGSSGFTSTGPDRLVAQDVIVVTHNYRLGPFGFLSTGDIVVPGNAGLKDQALALKWTYGNIAAFGGDPNKITIFGQSAGSASVGYQLLSTKNQGLFRAAIQESGSPLNDWASIADPKSYVLSLIREIDPNANVGASSQKQLAYLQSLDARLIDRASKTTTPALTLPVVEVDHADAFITKTMYEAFEQGNYNHVPVIVGCNSEEDVYLLQSHALINRMGTGYDQNPRSLLPARLVLTDESHKDQLAKEIKAIYLNENESFANSNAAVIRFGSDSGFTRGAIKQAELMSRYNNVFFYIFSYDGALGGWNKSVDGAEKVEHGEELNYIWVKRGHNEDLSKYPEEDRITSRRLIKLWTDFAKNVNPTPQQSDLLQNIIWPTIQPDRLLYLDINDNLRVGQPPKTSYPLWKAALEKYAQRPYITY